MPDGVLFGSSTAHKALRRMLVEDQKLDALVKLPGGVFKPYAGVSTGVAHAVGEHVVGRAVIVDKLLA